MANKYHENSEVNEAVRDIFELAGMVAADPDQKMAEGISRIIAHHMLARVSSTSNHQCECECECCEAATTIDNGVELCAGCADYYVTNDGDTVCSRVQGAGTCRHCGEDIVWASIQTGAPGAGNLREGECSCREWRETEAGGIWRLAETETYVRRQAKRKG